MAEIARTFILVCSVSPYNNGNFSRAGLRFSRQWRPLEVVGDDDENLAEGKISAATRKRLEEETFLATKPASAAEVERLTADQATGSSDPQATIASQAAQIADLEARLMRLEAGDAKPSKKSAAAETK